MDTIKIINYILAVFFFICYAYQAVYILVQFVVKAKPHKAAKPNRFAVLISARNEQMVIGNLIDSINRQTYAGELVTTFVVADNCTDDTARIAREHGAVVYERFNKEQVGKGYALNWLLQRMDAEYPDRPFDAYLVFDADNVLEPDYIEQINRTFSDGYEVVTSYRNSKNFGDNWISSGYALWFMRESAWLNRPRMRLGTSCAISGTGFGFTRKVLDECGGWNFFLLTEDIQFTVDNVVNGRRIGYCAEAMLYDEQPTKFKQSWNQRKRWARGYAQVFAEYGNDMIKSILRGSFAAYDMCMSIHSLHGRHTGYRCRTCGDNTHAPGHNDHSVVGSRIAQLSLFLPVGYWGVDNNIRVETHLCSDVEEDSVYADLPAVYVYVYPLHYRRRLLQAGHMETH